MKLERAISSSEISSSLALALMERAAGILYLLMILRYSLDTFRCRKNFIELAVSLRDFQ